MLERYPQCDVCGSVEEDVRRYRLGHVIDFWIELCGYHAAPIVALIRIARPVMPKAVEVSEN